MLKYLQLENFFDLKPSYMPSSTPTMDVLALQKGISTFFPFSGSVLACLNPAPNSGSADPID
jgi:hypothetical protein